MDKVKTKRIIKRPPFEGVYPYVVFLFLGYCIADLVALQMRGYMLPSSPPPLRSAQIQDSGLQSRGSFSGITSRNIFTADGSIPDALSTTAEEKTDERRDEAPVPSSLPLGLVGTIVHSNPNKSIANIEVRPKSTVIAVRPNQEIDNLATLVSVERGRIIIRNSNNQRLEFLELKNMTKLTFNAPKASATTSVGDVKAVGDNKFEIKRSDILKYTSDLSSVLQQAAMQPRRKANGEIDCFQFLSIQPGSIYTQLGFQKGDCLKSVNGEFIDSPAKAMEMYNSLKSAPNIKIMVERDGRDQLMDYTARD